MPTHNVLSDPSLAGAWTLNSSRSTVRFTNKTLWGLVPVNGRFTTVTGEGTVRPDGQVSGRLLISADSVHTGIGMRDRHLRSADFFDTEKFPEILVEVTGLAPSGELSANLGIRGTTLPVTLPTTIAQSGGNTLTISGRTDIDRTRWGVSGNMIGMMPTITTVTAELVFTR